MGKFSSDRSIAEYAEDIWKVEVCDYSSLILHAVLPSSNQITKEMNTVIAIIRGRNRKYVTSFGIFKEIKLRGNPWSLNGLLETVIQRSADENDIISCSIRKEEDRYLFLSNSLLAGHRKGSIFSISHHETV